MIGFERQRYILDLALSSMKTRKAKHIALIAVYTYILFLLASVLFSADSLKREASLVLQEAPEMIVQKMVAGRQELMPLRYIDSIGKIRGIQKVEARLWGYYFDSLNGATYTVMANPALQDAEGKVIIGSGVSRRTVADGENRRLQEGDIIPFKGADGAVVTLRVEGLLSSSSELVTSDLMLISEKDFRRIFAVEAPLATDLVLSVRNERELETIATKINNLHPDTRVILREQILRTYDAIFNWRGGIIIVILSGAICAFIILAWEKATGLSVEERREIGILKAVGWDTSDILLMKIWEGGIISMTSFILGIVLAYLHVFVTSSILFEPVLKGWSVLYPHFRLTPSISAYQIATLFFLTVLPYMVATIIPSWHSATIDPDSTMRS